MVCKEMEGHVDLPVAKQGGVGRKELCTAQKECKLLEKCRQWGEKKLRMVVSLVIGSCCIILW